MIIIVGVGALGSHVALLLRNLEHPIKLVDFDRVEQKNTLAQFHTKMGLRRNKAQALAQALQGMFGVRMEAIPHKLTQNNVSILAEADLIIDCTDNIAARKLLLEGAGEIPCLHGALSADGTFARVMWSEDFVADAEGEEGEATCEGGEHLPFFAATAAFMAVEVQRFLETRKKSSFQLTPAGLVRLT